MELKFWHSLPIIIGIIILFQFRSCSEKEVYREEVKKNIEYKETVKTYKAKNGELVSYNNTLKTNFKIFVEVQGDSIKKLLENIKIKKPEVIIRYKDTLWITKLKPIYLDISGCSFDTLFNIEDTFFNIAGRLNQDSLTIEAISIPNSTTVVIGDVETKWWERKEYITTVMHSNPHIKTSNIGSYTFKDKQSRWTVGPSIGYGIYYDPWKGFSGHGILAGVTINYKLISWKIK